MTSYILDVILCGLITIWQIIKALGIGILIQFISYKVFNFNIYKNLLRILDI